MTPDPSLQGAVERLTLYADWLADPDDDGNPYTGMEPEGEGKEVDLRTILAALPEPPSKCALCALGFAPFKAEDIMWHQVNGRDPFRCAA